MDERLENTNFIHDIIDADLAAGVNDTVHTLSPRAERISSHRLGKGNFHQLYHGDEIQRSV